MASYHFSVKTGKKGTAANHANYISRQGKYKRDEEASDLVAVSHGNLPDWAKNTPSIFFKAADKYERVNGASYKEYVFALPRELSPQQRLDVVNEFIETQIIDKPYMAAIHAPMASLGKGNHPHAHVITSDRKPDGIERRQEIFFSRYNANNPERGGCKKDSGGKDRNELRDDLIMLRENMAAIQNTHLEKNGFSARVDHRSNKDRGIKKEPERHFGQVRIKLMSDDEKALIKKSREVQ